MSETEAEGNNRRPVRAGETIAPEFQKTAFHCVYCHVLTSQRWTELGFQGPTRYLAQPIWRCTCSNCREDSWWLTFGPQMGKYPPKMIYPRESSAPPPHSDMPDDVLAEYREAADIVSVSPRGASALLRLALQTLMPHLGEAGGNLNNDIGALVSKGLPRGVQQALDSLRVIGNNAVHPGELDLRDDTATATALFDLLNYIVEDRIARPAALDSMYAKLPEGTKQGIKQRDSTTDPS